jgi:hypothetical protein
MTNCEADDLDMVCSQGVANAPLPAKVSTFSMLHSDISCPTKSALFLDESYSIDGAAPRNAVVPLPTPRRLSPPSVAGPGRLLARHFTPYGNARYTAGRQGSEKINKIRNDGI